MNLLTNVTEEIVKSLVTMLMRGPEYQTFCKCEQCEMDIIALSLNTLPAHYVTTDKGRTAVFERLNSKENLEWINKRIIHSIHVIGKYPHRS
ncbi:competence protein ComFB [Bacillus sp. FJAT-22090]|nr:competence protein ComFB [Bacillus sp. FJAT-22090]